MLTEACRRLPSGEPQLYCCLGVSPAFPTLRREARSGVSQLLCKWIFWKSPEQLLGHQALFISPSLWHPPDVQAWVSFCKDLMVCFARGLTCVQKERCVSRTTAPQMIYGDRELAHSTHLGARQTWLASLPQLLHTSAAPWQNHNKT